MIDSAGDHIIRIIIHVHCSVLHAVIPWSCTAPPDSLCCVSYTPEKICAHDAFLTPISTTLLSIVIYWLRTPLTWIQ